MTREELDKLRQHWIEAGKPTYTTSTDELTFEAAACNSVIPLLDHIDAQAAELAEMKRQVIEARAAEETAFAAIATNRDELDAQALVSAQLREEFKHCLDWLDASLGFSKWSDHDTRRAMELYRKALAITPSEAELRVTRWKEALEYIIQRGYKALSMLPAKPRPHRREASDE